jgi:hypothetical protein
VDHQLGPEDSTALLAMVAIVPVDFLLVANTGMMKMIVEVSIANKTLFQTEIMTILESNTAVGVMAVLV